MLMNEARRLPPRPLIVALLLVITAGSAISGAVPALASSPRCSVRDPTSGKVYAGGGGKLQAAISSAAHGSTLIVRGHCVGMYHVRKTLTLIGKPTAASPIPTLDAHDEGVVLTVRGTGRVEVRDLRITGGKGDDRAPGGGISNKARLIVSGTTRVSRNEGEFGAGIWTRGWLELRDTAAVVRNHARFFGVGGGIYNAGGVTRLRDASSVHANFAPGNGGGVFHNTGRLVVRNHASITGNHARHWGGGVYAESTMTLRGHASVTGNSAAASGGIYGAGRVYVCSTSVNISPNNPDDPPKTKPCS
jgi:hypothetical protein